MAWREFAFSELIEFANRLETGRRRPEPGRLSAAGQEEQSSLFELGLAGAFEVAADAGRQISLAWLDAAIWIPGTRNSAPSRTVENSSPSKATDTGSSRPPTKASQLVALCRVPLGAKNGPARPDHQSELESQLPTR